MKNHVQPGEVVTVAAPAGGVASGVGVSIGFIFGVAAYSADAGKPVEIATCGVFDLAKKAADTLAIGEKAYWDATLKQVTMTAASNKWIGVALAAALGTDATARVRLNGFAT